VGAVLDWWEELLNKSPRLTAKEFKKLSRASRNDKRIECFASVIKECGLAPIATRIPNRAYFLAITELEALRLELGNYFDRGDKAS
jgi:hypothetical protein